MLYNLSDFKKFPSLTVSAWSENAKQVFIFGRRFELPIDEHELMLRLLRTSGINSKKIVVKMLEDILKNAIQQNSNQ